MKNIVPPFSFTFTQLANYYLNERLYLLTNIVYRIRQKMYALANLFVRTAHERVTVNLTIIYEVVSLTTFDLRASCMQPFGG